MGSGHSVATGSKLRSRRCRELVVRSSLLRRFLAEARPGSVGAWKLRSRADLVRSIACLVQALGRLSRAWLGYGDAACSLVGAPSSCCGTRLEAAR
jgi:hypothetical protein